MKLNRFQELDKKKRSILIIGISVVLLIAIVLVYRSYAIYQEKQEFDVIKGSVPEYMSDYDVKISLMIDGVAATSFPSRDSGKVFLRAECDKGATGVWDYEHWAPLILNTTETRTKCKYQFVSKYHDSVLNGADPVLSEGLIPVVIDENGGVKKADLGSEWYNYSNKTWANAVTLLDSTKVYADGETIPESQIESYFVWIPRYRYKIFNDGNYTGLTAVEKREKTIEVVFESNTTNVSRGSGTGQWLTHPAFTSFNTNGMWVGKFETGYKGANSTAAAQSDTNSSGSIVIKPNTYSWRNIRVANAFTASYNYRRSMDSHMMKNTEWGAVAYLQHSAYGSQTSVRINNNSAYLTGYAAKKEPTCGYTATNEECNKYESTNPGADGTYTVNYNNNASVVASTTGNRSGVYDMSGGAWEYVMGVMVDKNGKPASGRNDNYNSNFIGTLTYPSDGTNKTKTSWTEADGGIPFPEEKYYDKYAYGEDDEHYNRRILGDATGEMGPFANNVYSREISSWYSDESWFLSNASWFLRGIRFTDGNGSGIFAFNRHAGSSQVDGSFRVVLSF